MNFWKKLIILTALTGVVVSMPGCSGCWEDPIARKKRLEEEEKKKKEEEEKKKKEEEEKKDDFETNDLVVLPSDGSTTLRYFKAGHWTVANLPMIANNYDIQARVHSSPKYRNQLIRLEGTPYTLETSRRISLPQEQWKDFELLYFSPRLQRGANSSSRTVMIENRVSAVSTGSTVKEIPEGLSEMKSHEYYMLVLSDSPDDYGYLKLLHSTQPPANDEFGSASLPHYRISLPKIERLAPLPTNALAWTSISVIVWDDFDPRTLTLDQQRAMLDWLHFGGQLIVSGPRSYSTLKGSFLKDYLPASEVEGRNLTNEDMATLSDHWTIESIVRDRNDKVKGKERLPIIVPDGSPLLGLTMTPHPDAFAPPGCEGLLLERRIGRGRFCLTGFPLDSDVIKNWASYDSFFNAVLLQRPSRRYEETNALADLYLEYADGDYELRRDDARLNSLIRYFSRDIESLSDLTESQRLEYERAQQQLAQLESNQGERQVPFDEIDPMNFVPVSDATALDKVDPRFGGWETEAVSGVGGWSDFSGTGTASRDILRKAAGISVPNVDFVLRILAIYLVVIAPVNWLIFRAIGRVELAWIAAPLIAIIGAGAVVRMAQLDIGFARSHTDLAVIEIHDGYRRAHLTRYTALYTSLSTIYQLDFEDDTALALPFSGDPNFVPQRSQEISVVSLERAGERDVKVRLKNVQIRSNTTGMVHSEQMYDLGGTLDYDDATGDVTNTTNLTYRDCTVVRRDGPNKISVARLGDLAPGTSLPLVFKQVDAADLSGRTADLFPPSTARDSDEDISLDQLLRLATEKLWLYDGEMRLVAWSDDKLDGLQVRPAASQYFGRSMVLAHLTPATLPTPKPDRNLRIDFKRHNSVGEGEMSIFDEASESGEAPVAPF